MRQNMFWMRTVSLVTAILLALPLPAMTQNGGNPSQQQAPPPQKQFSQEELAQLVAPIALYPDELVAQILMASTYPLEVVEADRWVQQYKDLTGDPLARALEQKNWDPSVKSLVNFPSVLSMMSQKLGVTSKLGDAFLNQEKDVLATVQTLRRKAYDAGNLNTSNEQNVVVEKETIVIQPADPQVIYIPTYNPTVVYGAWMYPDYPPYPYYAYPPPLYGVFAFASGIAISLAWGYAWGGCNWYGHNVNVNVWRNSTINNAYINRNAYVSHYQNRGMIGQNGQGTWQHDASHRRGVAYRDPATAQRYGQSPARASQAGRAARGYGDSRGTDQANRGYRGTPGQSGTGVSDRAGGISGVSPGGRTPTQTPRDIKAGPGQSRIHRTGASPGGDRGGANVGAGGGAAPSGGAANVGARGSAAPSGGRDGAFNRSYSDGASTRAASDRGQASRQMSGSGRGYGGGSSRPSGIGGGGGGSRPSSIGGSGGSRPSGGGGGGGRGDGDGRR